MPNPRRELWERGNRRSAHVRSWGESGSGPVAHLFQREPVSEPRRRKERDAMKAPICSLLAVALLTAWLIAGVSLASGSGAQASGGGVGPADPDATNRLGGTFPVKAPHSYGDGRDAGRGHRGQDLLASCGKPVVAALPGRVRVVDYQASGAGNYVVVKDRGSGFDHVYMHMLGRLSVSTGERVKAGDAIGRVGSTGRSSACHLHFEMWTAPGSYRGGDVADPTPHLRRWDRRG